MPYIKPENRESFESAIDLILEDLKHSGDNWRGDLNYMMSSIIARLIKMYPDTAISMILWVCLNVSNLNFTVELLLRMKI